MLTPDRIRQYALLVEDVRRMQRYFRRTQCPIARSNLPGWEAKLDNETIKMLADLGVASGGAEIEVTPEPDSIAVNTAAAGEGGAP